MLKDDVPTSHMHMDEEEIDAIHIDPMEKLHVDEDENDLQDVFGICVVKEEGDTHGSDIHQEACENKVMLHENELENADAIEFSNSISMVENTSPFKMDDKEVCTQVSYDSMDANNAGYHSASMRKSSDDESIYVWDTHSSYDHASSCDKAHNMYVSDALIGPIPIGVDAIEEADLATSKYAMFLDASMNDAHDVVIYSHCLVGRRCLGTD